MITEHEIVKLCAAQRIVQVLLDTTQERIAVSAVRLKDGTVLTGPTHAFCWDDAAESGELDRYLPKPYSDYDSHFDAWAALEVATRDAVDGFVTDAGRFLEREAACALARESEQLVPASNSALSGRLDVDDCTGI